MSERRKFVRFEVPLKAELIIKADIDASKDAVVKDFSREGLSLVLQDFDLKKGAHIRFRVFVPTRKEPVPVEGDVVWTKVDGKRQIGVKITSISTEAKSQILDYTYKMWKKKMFGSKQITFSYAITAYKVNIYLYLPA